MGSIEEILQRTYLQTMFGMPTVRASRQEILARHQQAIEQVEAIRLSHDYFIQTSSGGTVKKGKSSNLPLNPENRISINDMQIDKVHTGRFLLCRVIEKCVKYTA